MKVKKKNDVIQSLRQDGGIWHAILIALMRTNIYYSY